MRLFPRLAVDDPLDLGLRDSEDSHEFAQCHRWSQGADLLNLFWCQTCLPIPSARLHGAMYTFIVAVVLACAPLQVVQPIIKRVSIEMATLITGRAWPAEGRQYQAMNGRDNWFFLLHQHDLLIFNVGSSDTSRVRLAACPILGISSVRAEARVDDSIDADGIPWEARTMFGVEWWSWQDHTCDGITGGHS